MNSTYGTISFALIYGTLKNIIKIFDIGKFNKIFKIQKRRYERQLF